MAPGLSNVTCDLAWPGHTRQHSPRSRAAEVEEEGDCRASRLAPARPASLRDEKSRLAGEARRVPLAPGLQQQRLPPETSSQLMEKSRFRLRLPSKLPRNRALAWDFLTTYYGIALPALWSRALAGGLLATY